VTIALIRARPSSRARCEAEVSDFTKNWRDHVKRDYQCEMLAHYALDGKKLCRRHTGYELIRIHLGDTDANHS